jgi:sugar O-acyltransferase (sialic acid O-acetyltransferase NeuD family)
MIPIVIIGSGGQCKSAIDVIESTRLYEIIGILDDESKIGESINGYKIIGTDNDVDKYIESGFSFHIGVGQIKNSLTRQNIFLNLKNKQAALPTIIANTAYVSNNAILHEGSIIHHKAFVNSNVIIGVNCIINTGAIIEHDCLIEANCHVSTNATINGNCNIKENTFIGSNAVVSNGVSVETFNIVGAGSVLVSNTLPNSVYVGNPARKLN